MKTTPSTSAQVTEASERERAADLIRSRIGQEFDGEAHFSELEANIFIRLLLDNSPSPASAASPSGVRGAMQSARSFISNLVGLVGDADYAYEEKGELDALTHFGQRVGNWRFDGTFASLLDELDEALSVSLEMDVVERIKEPRP